MRKLALLALMLSLSLSACGGTPATTEDTELEESPAATEVQDPSEPEEAAEDVHAENVLASYGHVNFVNTDDERFSFYTPGNGLDELVNTDNIPDESLEPYCAVLPPDDEMLRAHALVFKTREGTEITEELKLSILTELLGRDTHMEVPLSDDSKFFVTYDQSDGYYNVVTLDEHNGELWVSIVSSVDTDDLLPCFKLENDVSFDEFFAIASAAAATQRIGTADLGFVDIPDAWVEFTDADNPDMYQYSSASGENIITLEVYTAEEFGVAEDELDQFALNIAYSFISRYQDNDQVESYESYTDELAGLPAYLIVSHWTDGSDMYTYVVDNHDKAYYIAIEGDPEVAFEVTSIVRESFSLDS